MSAYHSQREGWAERATAGAGLSLGTWKCSFSALDSCCREKPPLLRTDEWGVWSARRGKEYGWLAMFAWNKIIMIRLNHILRAYCPSKTLVPGCRHVVPKVAKSKVGDFSYQVSLLWKQLPATVREADTLSMLKSILKIETNPFLEQPYLRASQCTVCRLQRHSSPMKSWHLMVPHCRRNM